MKKWIAGVAGSLALLLALGIVGAVENGAELARMVWIIPLLAVLAGAVAIGNRTEEKR